MMTLSSDDEEETTPQSVTNYHFEDEDKFFISFDVLPIRFDDSEKLEAAAKEVYLRGTAEGGLKVYIELVAWKLILEEHQPRIMLLSKDKKWINLLKPRKSYCEVTIRKVMITIQSLHFLRRKPESSEKSLREHLCKIFSSFEARPSANDLMDHISLMKLFFERDQLLAQSQVLRGFVHGKLRKTSSLDFPSHPDLKNSFIAADDENDVVIGDDNGNDSDEDSDLFDSVCAFCDNGGEILCCDGICMRSFHAKIGSGADSYCDTLGFTKAEVDEMTTFLCENCQYKQHQCFACGKLGSSDKTKGAEVFPCVSATCGHFYHPECVAGLLFRDNQAEAFEFQKKIASGQPFTCPVHKCLVCKQGENKEIRDLQFAMCRRCPKSYHRKCLPREIAFEDDEDGNIEQRAWEDLLPHRLLIYCMDHSITDIGTPARNHIKFPGSSERKRGIELKKKKNTVLVKKKRHLYDDLAADMMTGKRAKVSENIYSYEESQSIGRAGRSGQHVLEAKKKAKPMKDDSLSDFHETVVVSGGIGHAKDKTKPVERVTLSKPMEKVLQTSVPTIDTKTEIRIKALMMSSSMKLEDIVKKFEAPKTHAYRGRQNDRCITHGKVEGSIEAIRAALKKLEEDGTVEDAKAVCGPEILKQILKWNNVLKVYLAPFLHGPRYTSFGRHFTKVEKLKEIVDKLQWYAQNGDMIVDFCCGCNDFSQLMKEQLVSVGKKCDFKNYDIIPPKNDFKFEKKDWMSVSQNELPDGSRLIMGLNPPFGVKGALANMFIQKALSFKPKLIILIVPRETERLDKKRPSYDLIWEDGLSLSGKSFYLPGSVDVNDKQMEQWNLKPPVLFFWSRADWTSRHKDIAIKCGHISTYKNKVQDQNFTYNKEEHPAKGEDQLEEQIGLRPLVENTSPGPVMKANTETIEAEAKVVKSSGTDSEKKSEDSKSKSHDREKLKMDQLSKNQEKEINNMSDMAISPSQRVKTRKGSKGCTMSDGAEVPSDRRYNQDRYLGPLTGCDALDGSMQSSVVLDDNIGATSRQYAPHGWPSGEIGLQNFQNSDGCYTSRDHNVERPYLSVADVYGRQSEAGVLMQGNTHDLQGNRFNLGNSDSVFSHHEADPSYALSNSSPGTSAIERNAPGLTDTNYMMPQNSNNFPLHPNSVYDMPSMGNGSSNSRDFAPAPNPLYRLPGSSGGWVDR